MKGRILEGSYHLLACANYLHNRLKNGSAGHIIVDVGAFEGDTAAFFIHHFPGCHIYAFEPNRKAFKVAQDRLAKYKDVHLFPFALDKEQKHAELQIADNGVSTSLLDFDSNHLFNKEKSEMIECKRLDDVLPERLGRILLLKMDVQGKELDVLRGAVNTLMKTSYILIEMVNKSSYHHSSKYYEVDLFLRSNGFVLASIFSDYNKSGLMEYDGLYENVRLVHF